MHFFTWFSAHCLKSFGTTMYYVFAFLIRSPYNNKLFVVAEEHSALKQSLDQLNLFSEDNPPSAAPVRMPLVLEI